jgi:hypothetical protein
LRKPVPPVLDARVERTSRGEVAVHGDPTGGSTASLPSGPSLRGRSE